MILSIAFGFVAGFFVGNGLPYYVHGSFGEEHRFLLGRSPVANVLAGCGAMTIGALAWIAIHDDGHTGPALCAVLVGVLVVGLIHARVWKAQGARSDDAEHRSG